MKNLTVFNETRTESARLISSYNEKNEKEIVIHEEKIRFAVLVTINILVS